MGRIATEQEVAFIVNNDDFELNKCCTYDRCVEMGCDTHGSYENNQLVQIEDVYSTQADYRCINVWGIKDNIGNISVGNLQIYLYDAASAAYLLNNTEAKISILDPITDITHTLTGGYEPLHCFILNPNKEASIRICHCAEVSTPMYISVSIYYTNNIAALVCANGYAYGVVLCNVYSSQNPYSVEYGNPSFDFNGENISHQWIKTGKPNPFDEPIKL